MADDVVQVTSPEHYRALAHPLRQRLLFTLGEPATISQLAAALRTNKGNVAHHLKVLREAGLVVAAATRQVRGGTERYYQRSARALEFTGDQAGANLPVAFAAIADEIAAAAPDPFLVLRHVRLTAAQAERIAEALSALAHDTQDAGPGQVRYGMLLGLYRQDDPRPDGVSSLGQT